MKCIKSKTFIIKIGRVIENNVRLCVSYQLFLDLLFNYHSFFFLSDGNLCSACFVVNYEVL